VPFQFGITGESNAQSYFSANGRKPGPITTRLGLAKTAGSSFFNDRHSGEWVLAFARTTSLRQR
jgi:hypothetical protein